MKYHIIKLVFGALVLAGLCFASYRYMYNRDSVEIQSAQSTYQDYKFMQTQGPSMSKNSEIQSDVKYRATGA